MTHHDLRGTLITHLGKEADKYIKLLDDHKKRINKSPGSKSKHQNWKRGYIDHLEEMIMIAESLYPTLYGERDVNFTFSDILKVIFFHDLEKPFKYVEPKREFNSDEEKLEFIYEMAKEYNIKLTDAQMNAIKYVHGEGNDHNPDKRVMNPLAAFVHCCDIISARIWYDFPKKEK